MNRFRAVAVLGIAASMGACADTVTITEPNGTLNRYFHWEGAVAPSQTVEVRGVSGGIRARRVFGHLVVVNAAIYGSAALASEVEVEVVRHADGITVCARYPDQRGRLIPCVPDRDAQGNVDAGNVHVEFTVEIPDSITFVGSTVNGAVEANLHGDVFGSSVNGNIDVVTEGITEASTVNGSIAASLGATNWGRALRFATVNGSVQAAIRRDADVRVEGSTLNGRIAADFPLTITNHGATHQIRGSLGAGTWSLLLSTVNGDIALRERR